MPQIIEITDFSAPELDVYARLRETQLLNRHEPENGIFIAERRWMQAVFRFHFWRRKSMWRQRRRN